MSRRLRFTRNLGRVMPCPSARRDDVGYVRFEHASERLGGVAYGLFSYVSDARAVLSGVELAALEALLTWFEDHLDEPARMVPFRDVGTRRARRRKREAMARCWFREDADEHLAKARELVRLLSRAGVPMVERRSDRVPGKLCAEDRVQIAVVGYRDCA
jgi:hypothetical protein